MRTAIGNSNVTMTMGYHYTKPSFLSKENISINGFIVKIKCLKINVITTSFCSNMTVTISIKS